MPILGTGFVPGGTQGTELSAITRRAFIPRLVMQIYQGCPLLTALIGNAQTAMGGISSVTLPVQGAPLVASQWSDFGASFNQPAYQAGVKNAEFNLKLAITPVPFLGTEALIQDAHAVVPRIEAVMNDATMNMKDMIATSLFGNTTQTNQVIGLPGAIDDGTTMATYGGLNRLTTDTYFVSRTQSMSSTAPTRALVMRNIASVFKQGSEMPTFGVMGVGTWMNLATDFVNNEAFPVYPDGKGFDQQTQGPRSGFTALMVAGVPIFADQYCPEGTLFLVNSSYLGLYMHHMAQFAFTGFVSTLPNWQVGYIAAVLTLLELVNTKPKTCGKFTAYTSATL